MAWVALAVVVIAIALVLAKLTQQRWKNDSGPGGAWLPDPTGRAADRLESSDFEKPPNEGGLL